MATLKMPILPFALNLKKHLCGERSILRLRLTSLKLVSKKMNLIGGFAKVNHFRSTSEYAYVIEFENSEDGQTFFDKIGTANYHVKKLDSVVVYGKSDSIDALK